MAFTRNIILALAALFILSSVNMSAQSLYDSLTDEQIDSLMNPMNYEMNPRYGVFLDFALNLHFADFRKLPGVPSCCPRFEFALGRGVAFGGLFEYPINDKLYLQLRGGYSILNGSFAETESTTLLIDGEERMGEFEHRLDAYYHSLIVEPYAAYQIKPNLFLLGGVSAGFNLYNHYEQIEEITKPSDRGTFLDFRRTRNHNWGELPDAASMMFGINLGASYQMPLNEKRTFFLSPEFIYNLNFTSPVEGTSWMVHQARLGASLKYKQGPPPPPPPPPPLAPPIHKGIAMPEEPPHIAADIIAVNVDTTGKEDPNFSIRIEDFTSLNMRPLLNYVFFEENSSQIPPRYKLLSKAETNDFSLAKLHNLETMETYYQVLNIIGKRLRDKENSAVEITGTNSGTGEEKNNIELSRKRAEAVRDYLRDTWGISEDRLKVAARNLPQEPTKSDNAEGEAENRRVEIISRDFEIIEPVITNDTMRVVSDYNIRFKPTAKSEAGIKKWKIKVLKDDKAFFEESGEGLPPQNVNWKITNEDKNIPRKSGFMNYSLEVEDSLGQTISTQKKRLPVERLTIDRKRLERIEDKEFEYYSLILFDYGRSNLAREHRAVVDLIKDRVNDRAKVYIYGYTDSLGTDEINKRISKDRAQSVARRLNIKNAEVKGIGEDDLLYDNDTPEGRFYCRTVQIIIETPVRKEDE